MILVNALLFIKLFHLKANMKSDWIYFIVYFCGDTFTFIDALTSLKS